MQTIQRGGSDAAMKLSRRVSRLEQRLIPKRRPRFLVIHESSGASADVTGRDGSICAGPGCEDYDTALRQPPPSCVELKGKKGVG
jgi:hypothetical protein